MKAGIIINEETLQGGVVSYFADEQTHSWCLQLCSHFCFKTKYERFFFIPSIHVHLKHILMKNRIHAEIKKDN